MRRHGDRVMNVLVGSALRLQLRVLPGLEAGACPWKVGMVHGGLEKNSRMTSSLDQFAKEGVLVPYTSNTG